MGEEPHTHTNICESSSKRSSDIPLTGVRDLVSTNITREAVDHRTQYKTALEVVRKRTMNDDLAPSGREGGHSLATSTLLQQLHILLNRTIETRSYAHVLQRQKERRDTVRKE